MKDMCIPLMFKPYQEAIDTSRFYILVYKAKRVSHDKYEQNYKYEPNYIISNDFYGPYEKITKSGTILRHILDFACAFRRIIKLEHEKMFG